MNIVVEFSVRTLGVHIFMLYARFINYVPGLSSQVSAKWKFQKQTGKKKKMFAYIQNENDQYTKPIYKNCFISVPFISLQIYSFSTCQWCFQVWYNV